MSTSEDTQQLTYIVTLTKKGKVQWLTAVETTEEAGTPTPKAHEPTTHRSVKTTEFDQSITRENVLAQLLQLSPTASPRRRLALFLILLVLLDLSAVLMLLASR